MRGYQRLMHRCRDGQDDAGAVLVIWAVALAGLMAFAAMAVDLGNIAQTKQHAETAAQDAVLAGVLQLETLFNGTSPSPSVATAEASATSTAEQYIEENYSSVQSSDFANPGECPSTWPAGITVSSTTNCIGFFAPNGGADPYAMAVAMPTRTVDYTLGKAAGLTSQGVSAVAYASLQRETGDSGGFPFSYTVTGGPGEQCLKTGSATPCPGFATGSGQFGVLDSPRYRVFPGYTTSSGKANSVTPTDVVLGFDHQLNVFGTGPAGTLLFCDSATSSGSCPYYNGYPSTYPSTNGPPYWDWANEVMPSTGQAKSFLSDALVLGGVTTPSGGCTLEPLFVHFDGFTPSQSCSSDNPYPTAAPPSCPSSGTSSTTIPADCPDFPFLSGSNSDTLNSSYPLNGRSIADYLNATGKSLSSGTYLYGGTTLPGCDSLLPNPSASPASNATTTALDALTGTTYTWASYDACLGSDISTLATDVAASSSSSGSTWYAPGAGATFQAIFDSSILSSPRFGQVPLIATAPGGNPEEIVGIADVYLDNVFVKSGDISSVNAFVFPQWMVTGGGASSVGGSGAPSGGALVPYLCSYGTPPC